MTNHQPPMEANQQAVIEELKALGSYGRFSCIYADPPWSKNQRGKYGAESHYDLMTMAEIQAMPINYMTADNALMFLWVTPGLIREGIETLEAFGFTYVDEMVWDKDIRGLGRWFRHQHEPCLIGIKGKPKVLCKNMSSVLRAVRQDHSHKPEEMFCRIERMAEPPYLELFARRQPTTVNRTNWAIWGNEVDSDIYIPGYPVPNYSDRAVLPEGVPRHQDEVKKGKDEEVA